MSTKNRRQAQASAPSENRRDRAFHPHGPGVLRVTEEALIAVEGDVGRLLRGFRRTLFGIPLTTAQEVQERLTKVKALAVLGSDNLSSSAYATEELVRVLALAGVGALSLTMPLALAIVGVLTIVVLSYRQVIRAYPSGGGSYLVSRENLGTYPGLVAVATLLIDYVLTVAVSVAAGVAALTSAFPELFPYRVPLSVGAIALLAIGNLRGVRESGTLFTLPVYTYLVGMLGLVAYGLFRVSIGTLPDFTPPPDWLPATAAPLTLMLVLRAFSSGAVALTGVEAISDSVQALKQPESSNARATLTWMALLFATIFLGLSFLAWHSGIIPNPSEQETLVSQLTRLVIGTGWLHLIIQFSAAFLLIMAANTAFNGFPRLGSILAKDHFMPHQLGGRGERLVFSTGVLVLSGLAAVFVVIFGASVAALIPLYTVGVFVAFTLSQIGMVRHWRRRRTQGWKPALVLNGAGGLVTGVVAVESLSVKFVQGAWVLLVLVPLLVLMMQAIRRHYVRVENELPLPRGVPLPTTTRQQVVLIPVSTLNRAFAEALSYARALSTNITGIHISESVAAAEEFRRQWTPITANVPLVTIESPYRDFMRPLLAYVEEISQANPDALITVVIPEFVPKRWWEHLLHRQSALRLKLALLTRPNIVVVDIPYQLKM